MLDEAELGLVVWAGEEVGGGVTFGADDRGQVPVVGAAHGLHAAGGAEVGGVADVAVDDEHASTVMDLNRK